MKYDDNLPKQSQSNGEEIYKDQNQVWPKVQGPKTYFSQFYKILLVTLHFFYCDDVAFITCDSFLVISLVSFVCKDIMVDYSNQVMKLGTLLFELLSEALSLNSTYLRDTSCDVGQFAFGHYYPSYLEPNLTLGTIKHVDVNFITVLLQGHIGGLQVLHQNTQIDVTPVPGALVFNIGDFLQTCLCLSFPATEYHPPYCILIRFILTRTYKLYSPFLIEA